MSAVTGMVSIHVKKMVRIIDHWVPQKLCEIPTPAIAPVTVSSNNEIVSIANNTDFVF